MTIDQKATLYIAENGYTKRDACIAYAAYIAGAREINNGGLGTIRPMSQETAESLNHALEKIIQIERESVFRKRYNSKKLKSGS